MSKYIADMTYEARIRVEVDASNEGEALDKARDYAEIEADAREFTICNEKGCKIFCVE